LHHSPWPSPRCAPFLNSGPFPPPELPGFPGTTSLTATPSGPACPSRASGWDLASRRMGLPVLQQVPVCRHAVTNTPVGPLDPIVQDEGLSTPRLSPATAAFPDDWAGRLPHHDFRGLLGVHSRYSLPTRRTAQRYVCLEGSDGFVTSTAAPIASGWSDQTSPGGTCTHWDTVPYHGAPVISHYWPGVSIPRSVGTRIDGK
jgi:hypothetical protein